MIRIVLIHMVARITLILEDPMPLEPMMVQFPFQFLPIRSLVMWPRTYFIRIWKHVWSATTKQLQL